MPRSKRQQVVSLTKTDKKATREHKANLMEEVQQLVDTFPYVWVFETEHMRNQYLQEVRQAWKPDKMMMGKKHVLQKALGKTAEDEHKAGCAQLGEEIHGQRGLLFTSSTPFIVTDWFASFTKPDYARTGNIAPETVVIPAGPVMMDDRPAAHSLEPQLRKLGMSTKLDKGVPTLDVEHILCKQGQELNSNQTHLLKLFNKPMATFQVKPIICLNTATGELIRAEDVQPEEIAEDA